MIGLTIPLWLIILFILFNTGLWLYVGYLYLKIYRKKMLKKLKKIIKVIREYIKKKIEYFLGRK